MKQYLRRQDHNALGAWNTNVSYCLFHGVYYPHQHSVDTPHVDQDDQINLFTITNTDKHGDGQTTTTPINFMPHFWGKQPHCCWTLRRTANGTECISFQNRGVEKRAVYPTGDAGKYRYRSRRKFRPWNLPRRKCPAAVVRSRGTHDPQVMLGSFTPETTMK